MVSAKNNFWANSAPLKVSVLVLDACNTLSFAAAVDPMRAANRIAKRPLFDWQFATKGAADAQLTSGISVPGVQVSQITKCDMLIVVAGFQLDTHLNPDLLASLRRIARTGATLAGIDGGPWILAAAGLLDHHSATTHWEDLSDFADKFPLIDVVHDRYHVSGNRLTSGGAAPAIDMMLHIISTRYGAALAQKVASAFIYDTPDQPLRPQMRHRPAVSHSHLTARATALMETTLDQPVPIEQIARQLGVSQRALEMHFKARLGTSPKSHYLSLRLTEAHRLVEETERSLHNIALATGFASQSTFARAFRAAFGQSARALRKQDVTDTRY